MLFSRSLCASLNIGVVVRPRLFIQPKIFGGAFSLMKKMPLSKGMATDADVKKAFLKAQVIRTSVREFGAKELIQAIKIKDYKKAELLVKSGVNVNGHDAGENTPLTDAAARGDTKGVEFLLKNLKANPSASCDCPYHKTALHYASENGHAETVKMLLKYGARADLLDSRKYTAMHCAAKAGYIETVRVLFLESGSDSKAQRSIAIEAGTKSVKEYALANFTVPEKEQPLKKYYLK